jgi:hypothetical protein
MPRIDGRGTRRLLLALLVLVILFAFTPISRALLGSVNGSFAQTSYSALALKTPSDSAAGVRTGKRVAILLTNHTGHSTTYHWSATQNGALISLGETTLRNGKTTTIHVPSRGADRGTLQIALTGTNVYITVPIRKS